MTDDDVERDDDDDVQCAECGNHLESDPWSTGESLYDLPWPSCGPMCHYCLVGLCNRLAAEVAALKAANERLTPKPMTLEELAAVLRDRKAHGHDDWEAGSTHIYSRDGDLEYSPFGARMRSCPYREKTIHAPSGDHAGNESSSSGFDVRLRCREPSVRIT